MAGLGHKGAAVRTLVFVLSLITLGHLGARRAFPQLFGHRVPKPVSPRTPGDTLPATFFEGIAGVWPPPPGMECLTVVAFDPSCPQTKRAVERRRVLGLWEEAPVLWLARERTPGVTKFEKSLPKGDRLLADDLR